MMTVKEVLKNAKDRLRAAGIDTWSLDAELLVTAALGLERMQLVTRDTDTVDEKRCEKLAQMLDRRLEREPVQYILGHCEFMGLEFAVNKNVLIPRPDTEILVEEVLKFGPESALDMCTGSGAIAVSLAKYGVGSVTAADISPQAIETAEKNAEKNGVAIDFVCGDLFENIRSRFGAVVSNPPYIARDIIKTLEAQVRDHEPELALDGGPDGLDFYRKIIAAAPGYLLPNGLLAFEIGYDQGAAVGGMMKNSGFADVRVIKDLAGLDRVVLGVMR